MVAARKFDERVILYIFKSITYFTKSCLAYITVNLFICFTFLAAGPSVTEFRLAPRAFTNTISAHYFPALGVRARLFSSLVMINQAHGTLLNLTDIIIRFNTRDYNQASNTPFALSLNKIFFCLIKGLASHKIIATQNLIPN